MNKTLLAVLMCDRKIHNMFIPLDSMVSQTHKDTILYFNIETNDPKKWQPLIDSLKTQGLEFHYDFWSFESSWWKKPEFDQDQTRLVPICMGRNMAIDCALDLKCDWLMFCDSDMRFPDYSLERLLARNKKMIGGYVRGRNKDKHAEYIFGHRNGIINHPDGLVECDHGNIGFCLISHEIYSRLRFRRGGASFDINHLQADDPNFCFDALEKWGFERHFIDRNVQAEHIDEEHIEFKEGAQY